MPFVDRPRAVSKNICWSSKTSSLVYFLILEIQSETSSSDSYKIGLQIAPELQYAERRGERRRACTPKPHTAVILGAEGLSQEPPRED